MNILSEPEREALLKSLSMAPDEILVDAVRQYKDWRSTLSSSFKEVQSFAGLRPVEAPKPEFKKETAPIVDTSATARKNVSPGEPSIGKIGSIAKEEILKAVNNGIQPPAKYKEEHCKLLLKRGEIKFDGTNYYV